ncbi:putative fatty acyl-CoA reductase CG5065 isoform X2 [Andrena cerasifolii]|uniref:putative fatty acyl-CoA reductase CG5065 isoform X2 n=1 Tax=Andrena cerasifolii TaxID=2819439 RepID=UPI0040383604
MYLFKASGTRSELYAVQIYPSLNSHRLIAILPFVQSRYTVKMTSEGGNAYIDDISYQCDESSILNPEKSKIAEWFSHTNVLITGGTGFLGKLIVEKLLRSCPGITTMYMIVRPKKGKSSEQRFKENFEDAVYDRLRREQPNFLNKVIMVDGDAMQEDYGLSPETKTMLMNTNIIFHAAATVRFDEKMRLAVNINVTSTKYLLLLAKQMPHLKAFVHVSTAFSNCIHKNIDEIHYRPPIDGDKLISLLDIFDDEQLEQMTPMLLKNWPNMYIFSKAVGESIVAKYSEGIPTCIVRPSIVISTAEEPLIGWINNLNGIMGGMLGVGLGVLHTLHCIPEYVVETIPADYVVSTTIAAAWGTSNMLLDTYKKIHKFINVIHYFSTHEWNFSDDNVQKLWQGLNCTDQGIFMFNIKNLDWNNYFYGTVRGIRMFLMKESPNTVEAARRRYQKLKIVHYTIMTLTFLLMLWVTVHFLSFLWSLCPLAH